MNDVVQAIEQSFRRLLEVKRYRSIRVLDVCEDACVSRKTFYAYFPDKEGIVDYIFKRDVLGPLTSFNELFTREEAFDMTRIIQEKVYGAVYNDGEYYKNLVKPMKGHDDTFIRVVTNAIYDFDIDLLRKHSYKGSELHADYVAYYFSASQAMIIQKWICDDFNLSVSELADLYTSMTLSFWEKAF